MAFASRESERTSPDHTDRYGADPLQIVDLFGSRVGAGRGLVVLLHGGFWRNRWDRTHLYPMATALALAGYTVALPEYRRLGDAGGGWPGAGDDVLQALRVIPELVRTRYGESATVSTTLVGHSAGGHLALWSQAQHVSVSAVVSLAGVLDLKAALVERLSDGAVDELIGSSAPKNFESTLSAADPMVLDVPTGVSITLVHGSNDSEVPVSYSRRYAARQPQLVLEELPGVGHYELIDPGSPAWAAVLSALD